MQAMEGIIPAAQKRRDNENAILHMYLLQKSNDLARKEG